MILAAPPTNPPTPNLITPATRAPAESSPGTGRCDRSSKRFKERSDPRAMNVEMWRFLAVVALFAIVLAASYWFVLLPDGWAARPTRRFTGKREKPGREQERDGGEGR